MTFVLVGGRVSLDLLATLDERRDAATELLDEPVRAAEWAVVAGLVDELFPVGPDELLAVHQVREALYRAVAARGGADRLRAADIAALNRAARPGPVTLTMGWNGSLRRRGDVAQVLSSVVRDGLELLAGPQLDRVRECDRPACTRLYVDASRTRNRRWCDMAECGNRAKVAAFRHRQHGWGERTDPFALGPPAPLTAVRGRVDPRRLGGFPADRSGHPFQS